LGRGQPEADKPARERGPFAFAVACKLAERHRRSASAPGETGPQGPERKAQPAGAGLYSDGNPVPDSRFTATVANGVDEELHVLDVFGLAQDVPTGTHEITVGWKGTSPNAARVAIEDRERSGALFVGG
jgi:hypothetical protein